MENLRESANLGNGKSLFAKGLREVFVSLNQRVNGSSPLRGTRKACQQRTCGRAFFVGWRQTVTALQRSNTGQEGVKKRAGRSTVLADARPGWRLAMPQGALSGTRPQWTTNGSLTLWRFVL